MLALNTSFRGLSCGVLRFWRLRVAKDFTKPEYYIGQTVVWNLRFRDKEFSYFVDIVGIAWTNIDWQYLVSLAEDNPFPFEDQNSQWVDAKELRLASFSE